MRIFYSKILMQCDRCMRRLCDTKNRRQIAGFIVLLCARCEENGGRPLDAEGY